MSKRFTWHSCVWKILVYFSRFIFTRFSNGWKLKMENNCTKVFCDKIEVNVIVYAFHGYIKMDKIFKSLKWKIKQIHIFGLCLVSVEFIRHEIGLFSMFLEYLNTSFMNHKKDQHHHFSIYGWYQTEIKHISYTNWYWKELDMSM